MASKVYLKLRGRTWYVQVSIPERLRNAARGKSEYIKSLKTGDLNEANRRKHPYIAAFKQRIATLERLKADAQAPAELAELYEKALAWRDTMEKYKDKVLIYEGNDPDKPYYAKDEFLSQISDEAEEFAEEYGDKAAAAFSRIAKGEGTPLLTHVDAWLSQEAATVTGQTISQHRTAVNAFLAWAGEGELIEDVDRKRAGEYVAHLLASNSAISRRTAGRYVSSLSSFWKWLEARGLARGNNPWRGQGIGKKSSRGEAKERSQWTDEALMKVLNSSYTPRYTEIFHDLVRLSLVTGARMEELCALMVSDVHQRDDGWWITIREGKTEAALRDIPVHESAAHVLKRRLKEAKSYLFDRLLPGGPDKKRSWHVSKAFGRFTRKLGLGEERQVFHALRNTFVEVMEAAEVPESTVKLIIGHARQSMTFGRYSKGKRVQLRDAINKLHYASGVMRLIRKEAAEKPPTQKNTKRRKTKPHAASS
jgi:integrase